MKQCRGEFVTRRVGSVVEVWLPPVDHPEGELICAVHESLLPALVAALKAA
jgi:hypothetical protein